MEEHELEFEAGPFEMEEEARWPRSRRPPVQPAVPHSPPGRPQPPGRRVIRPRYRGPIYLHDGGNRCDVLLVLEGYRPSSSALEPHHEPMLQRLAAHLERISDRRTLEVVAAQPSSGGGTRGDIGDERTKAVVDRLRALLKSAGARMAFRRLARRTTGPSRVEIRMCMEGKGRTT